MAFYFLDPVTIANSEVETYTQAGTLITAGVGAPVSVTGQQTVVRDLLGFSSTAVGNGGATTVTANVTGAGTTEVHGTTTVTASAGATVAGTSTIGVVSARTADWGSSETTTSTTATRTGHTTVTTSVRSFGTDGSYTTSAKTFSTTEEGFTRETFTTVATSNTYFEVFSTTSTTNFGTNAISFEARVYAEPGEVLYVFTGATAAATVCPGGPGWVTATSARVAGAPRSAISEAAVGPGGSFSFLVPDVTWSLTFHTTVATATATITCASFNESVTTTTTRTVAATELQTTGGGPQANTTVSIDDGGLVGTSTATLTGWSTLTDFVTDTAGSDGPPRTCVTTATTTYTAPTMSGDGNTIVLASSSTASVPSVNFSTFIVQGRTRSVFAAPALTNWANGFMANPYGPAARLFAVPQGGYQVAGAHGPAAAIYEAGGGAAPEFAMQGGVLVATETDASAGGGARTEKRTVEDATAFWGEPAFIGQPGVWTQAETALLPYGAVFFAPHGSTALTSTAFLERVSVGAGGGTLLQTVPWMEYDTMRVTAFPVLAAPDDITERVFVGTAYQNVL